MKDTTVVLGVPVYNDEEFIDLSVQNALDCGYEHVVYLDDGSTDGSLKALRKHEKEHSHIHVFENKENSVYNRSENRWYTLAKLCKEYDTDWIMVRAADEIFSYYAHRDGEDFLRRRLNELTDYDIINFPKINLHRSNYWYRFDSYWKHSCVTQCNDSCWNNRRPWDFVDNFKVSGFHLGAHRPNKFSTKPRKETGINIGPVPYDLIILHYGLSTHERIADKLDYQMRTANALGGGTGIMPTDVCPPISSWLNVNGYKVAYEFNLILKPVEQKWFKEKLPRSMSYPKIKSLYDVIAKYNKERAKEYKILFERMVGK